MSRENGGYTQLRTGGETPRGGGAQPQEAWLNTRQSALFRSFLKECVTKNVVVKTANGWPLEAENVRDVLQLHAKDIAGGMSKNAYPAFIFIGISEALEPTIVLSEAKKAFPKTTNIHVATSCQGTTTDAGFITVEKNRGRSTLARSGSKDFSSASKDSAAAAKNIEAVAVLAVFDPLGSYATLGQPAIDDKTTTVASCHANLDRAYLKLRSTALDVMCDPANNNMNKPADEPLAQNLRIWMSGLPGTEEKTLEAVYAWSQSRFNRTVPVSGGTAADGTITGMWRTYCNQWDNTQQIFGQDKGQGVTFTMISSSVRCFPLFMHPYTPSTKHTCKVIQACMSENFAGEPDGRVIHKVIDENGLETEAGSLYYRWCEQEYQKNHMPPPEKAGSPDAFNPSVLAASAACPLGVPVARTGDDAYDYRMLHPSGIYWPSTMKGAPPASNSGGCYLKAFATCESEKTDLVFFKASRGDLLNRLAKFKEQLIDGMDRSSGNAGESVAASPDAFHARVAGALMVYCAGCMMRVSAGKDGTEQMRRLVQILSGCFGGRPFLAYHPFGEQGFYPSKDVNHHGNLMFAAMVFTKDPAFELDETRDFDTMMQPLLKKFSLSDRSDIVQQILQTLVSGGHAADFMGIGRLISMNEVSATLLRDIVVCSGWPIRFSLGCAEMFYKMASLHPLQAARYYRESDWFKSFLVDFMQDVKWIELERAQLLDDPCLARGVGLSGVINCGGFVATNAVQELMELIWRYGLSVDEATKILAGMESSASEIQYKFTISPKMKFIMNTISLVVLALLQYTTSQHYTDSLNLWLLCLCFSLSHLLQMLASPDTGFYTWIHVIDDVFIVGAHLCIVISVAQGGDVPRDLDAMTMLLHFANITKNLVVNPLIGSLVITLITMVGNVGSVVSMLAFYGVAFLCVFSCLFRELEPTNIGHTFSPGQLLVAIMSTTAVMWEVPEDNGVSLFVSKVTGWKDSESVNLASFIFLGLCTLTLPILLINLMIAVMSSSYAQAQAEVETQMKVQFAACTLQARGLAIAPLPFSLPWDLYRCFLKLFKQDQGSKYLQERELSPEAMISHQMGVEQLLTQWEIRSGLTKLKSSANNEQVERMRAQIDLVQDRVQVLYNCLLDTKGMVDVSTKPLLKQYT